MTITAEAQGFMLAVSLFAVLCVWGMSHAGRAILRGLLKTKHLSSRAQAGSYVVGGALGSVALAWMYGNDGNPDWLMGIFACIPIAIMGVLVSLETWKHARPGDQARSVPKVLDGPSGD